MGRDSASCSCVGTETGAGAPSGSVSMVSAGSPICPAQPLTATEPAMVNTILLSTLRMSDAPSVTRMATPNGLPASRRPTRNVGLKKRRAFARKCFASGKTRTFRVANGRAPK